MRLGDRVVGDELLGARRADGYWDAWQQRLRGTDGEAVCQAALDVRATDDVGSHLSVLRVIDIVVWMSRQPTTESTR